LVAEKLFLLGTAVVEKVFLLGTAVVEKVFLLGTIATASCHGPHLGQEARLVALGSLRG